MAYTLTKPLDDKSMWRKTLARMHPDTGGEHDLFVWIQEIRDAVCEGETVSAQSSCGRSHSQGETERIPYDSGLGYIDEFVMLTMRALSVGQGVEEPYGRTLALLIDCPASDYGRQVVHQERGASYKQLAYIGHLLGLSKSERGRWYEIARSIPLSDRHASHILSKLKQGMP